MTVKIFVAVTHKPWFDYLASLAPPEVNFWQPSGRGEFRALRPGDLFLFKLKSPWNVIAGGGVFAHSTLAPLSLAWDAFGALNGNPSVDNMRSSIAQLRGSGPLDDREDPTIGCRILAQPFFWPMDHWIPAPTSFARQTMVGRGYSTDDAEGLALWNAVEGRSGARDLVPRQVVRERDRFGNPSLVQPRLGQGAFRLTVTDGYNRRCAVSGEKTLPILDAAHIRSYSAGGKHEPSNGLLLRTDIHKLFDRGYVTITDDLRFAVGERLKADFDNGAHYYAMQGREVALPRRAFAPPSRDALRWHRENRFLG